MEEQSMASYTVLDLFCGAGGLTRGFVDEGFAPVGAVEWDVAAAATYAVNFGPHVYPGDIVEYVARQPIPKVDVVVGGPPCQGFSNLGHRRFDDPRNRLWRAYAEVVQRADPYVFVLENVDHFLASRELRSLRWHCRRGGMLEGYRIAFARQVNAADFGVPQRRIRTIVVGVRRELTEVLDPEPTHAKADPTSPWITVGDVFADVAVEPDGIALPDRYVDVTFAADEGVAIRGAFRTDELHLGRQPTELSLRRFAKIPEGGNWRNLPDDLKAPCWVKRTTSGSGDVMGRLRAGQPSVTIRTEFNKPEKGRYLHPTADRAITHLEAALLMGFPSRHLWCGSKTDIARQIGNAVPPPLAAAIARSVRATLHKAGIEREQNSRVA